MSAPRGMHFLAGSAEAGDGAPFTALDPITGAELPPAYREASAAQVERACVAAAAAAAPFAAASPATRAALLRDIADGLQGLGDALVERIHVALAAAVCRRHADA